MKKSTEELLRQLRNTKDIMKYLETETDNIPSVSLSEYLDMLLKEKGLKKSAVVKASGIEKTYLYQIFRGGRSHPSRDKLLLISIGMGLELNETQRLLRIAACGELYPKDRRDSVIIWAILNGKSVIDTNILLDDATLPLLE